MNRGAASLAIWVSAFPAYSQMTTGELLRYCEASPATQDFTVCLAFVMGAHGMHSFLMSQQQTAYYCLPRGPNVGQMVAVVKQWAATNPATWHEDATLGILNALGRAFPCRR